VSDENKMLVRRLLDEAWNGGRLEDLDTLVAENCRFHDPVFPSMAPGTDSLRRHIRMCRNAFPDLKCTIDDMIAERDEVVVHWTIRGTQRQSFLGMAPTNRTATISGTTINRIENGKIVEQWSDWNLLSLMEQLGLATAPKQEAPAPAMRK
jgi:steroid delta-isomerase-like uncharacterized protein